MLLGKMYLKECHITDYQKQIIRLLVFNCNQSLQDFALFFELLQPKMPDLEVAFLKIILVMSLGILLQ